MPDVPDAPETVEADGSHDGARLVSAPVSIDAPQFQVAAKHPRRAEGAAAVAFLVALAAFAAFGGAYWQNANNYILGITLGVALFAFGYGLVVWGKYLMPRGPFEEPRPQMATTPEERADFVADFATRGKIAIERRGFLAKLMGAAGAVLGIVVLFPLVRSLGPRPGRSLYHTTWRKGATLTSIDGKAVNVVDINVGGVITVFPQNDVGGALSQTILIRLKDSGNVVTAPGRETWGPHGYLAFSKVCTHAGCPVGLYQELTQQLLCPCHQSLFDIEQAAVPVFGPAPRPLPQLPLYVDSQGYLRAQADYDEPIGPGFWYRGGSNGSPK
ncbi:MAG: Rieske (2Fe-2S) domain protein [Acidimicrobiaceae bacterium]|jgi:ubiquinol-cytochrome c reductase iron-sulfur subunit|nr:Rieske (2Fe-2S) domain protein [Acidimicrobiaceae bacterium]